LLHKGFYAPTFFFLRDLTRQFNNDGITQEQYPYKLKKTLYRSTEGKGKHRALQDEVFEREIAWVKKAIAIEEGRKASSEDLNSNEEEDENEEDIKEDESDGEDEEDGIECGCCFSKFRFVSETSFQVMYTRFNGCF